MNREALVVGTSRGWATVVTDDGSEVEARLGRNVDSIMEEGIATGDIVDLDMSNDPPVITDVHPRRTLLSRPDPHEKNEKPIAANVDLVVHVNALRKPPLRPRLIDRYLVAIARSGADPALVVNKIDLAKRPDALEDEIEELGPYLELEIPIVLCSTKTGEGIEGVRDLIRGKTVVFVGHSGVGKSSLLNSVADVGADVGAVSADRRGSGKHTTRSSTLYDLGDGTRIIDTPGVREFAIENLEPESVRFYFPEIFEIGQACRFRDCTHTHEPGCAVKSAVEEGEIDEARFGSYVRILEDLRDDSPTRSR